FRLLFFAPHAMALLAAGASSSHRGLPAGFPHADRRLLSARTGPARPLGEDLRARAPGGRPPPFCPHHAGKLSPPPFRPGWAPAIRTESRGPRHLYFGLIRTPAVLV